jgi:transmembrane protein EpsG
LLITLLLGLICLIVNFIAYFQKNDWGLKISFFLIFLFLGLRYDFGNDYETYINLFNRVAENEDIAFDQNMYFFYEPGWMFLNWLFRPIGFFGMTIAIASFYSITIYKLIKKYIPPKYYWLAVFFVVFNPGFLLVHSTTMRQTVAILIFLSSLNYILEKRIFLFIICILFAATFHYTSLTTLMISPFLFNNRKVSVLYGYILFAIYLLLFLLGNTMAPYFGQLVSLFSERYGSYSDEGTANSGLGFLLYSSLFLLTIKLDKLQDKTIALFFKLGIVYFMLMPFTLIIEMTSRIGMYYSPAVVIVYPFILKTLKLAKPIFLLVMILFTIYQFFQFFYSSTYKDYFMEYHTIFSAPKWN